jgi:hypothetical protein
MPMFFIAGTRRTGKAIGQFAGSCRNCSKSTAHTAVRVSRFITLFFVPLIPIGQSYLVVCNVCGLKLSADGELRERLETWAKNGSGPMPDEATGGKAGPPPSVAGGGAPGASDAT